MEWITTDIKTQYSVMTLINRKAYSYSSCFVVVFHYFPYLTSTIESNLPFFPVNWAIGRYPKFIIMLSLLFSRGGGLLAVISFLASTVVAETFEKLSGVPDGKDFSLAHSSGGLPTD